MATLNPMKPRKNAIVTGANSGIGFEVCRRLLTSDKYDFHITLACRNKGRGDEAITLLKAEFQGAKLDLILCDTGDIESVLKFCDEIKLRHSSIHYLFCNAGILSNSGLDWIRIFHLLFTDLSSFLIRSDALSQFVGEINQDGLGKVFAVNVFGHFAMIKELESALAKSGDGRIIWTSSLTSEKEYFDFNDYQGVKSKQPYESSKWLADILSIYLDTDFQSRGLPIHSFMTHPGVVASNIGELAQWIIFVRKIAHYTYRLYGEPSQTITSIHGSLSNVFVALEEPVSSLNPHIRYGSYVTRLGKEYVGSQMVEGYDEELTKELVSNMENLRKKLITKYRNDL